MDAISAIIDTLSVGRDSKNDGGRKVKAILVIDRPVNGCESCMFDTYGRCMVKANLEKMNDSSYCPLKPMPNKRSTTGLAYSQGWNDCLEELEK